MKMPAYFLLGLISIVLIAVIACGGAESAPRLHGSHGCS